MLANPGQRDRIFGVVLTLASFSIVAIFALILGDIISNGIASLSVDFVSTEPLKSGRSGGIAPILVSTFLIVAVAMVAATPVALGSALLLAEFCQRQRAYAIFIRKCLDVLASIPSIVFGLFGNALFCIYLDFGFSILSGGLTLACMVLPVMIKTTEEALRAVPEELRRGIGALGFSKTAAVWHVILPVAMPGVVVGAILGFGRAAAETAALIFTSGYVDRMPESLFDSGRSLSVHIFDLAMNVPGGDKMAYTSALCLVLILIAISVGTSTIARSVFAGRIISR